jgi:HEAT repeat protein
MPIGNSGLLLIVMAAGVGASLFIVLLVATRRVARLLDDRHRSRVEPPVRLLLIQAIADNHIEPELVLARGSRGRALERIAIELLGKTRGEAHELLTNLLDERGFTTRTLRQASRRGRGRRALAAERLGAIGSPEASERLEQLTLEDHSVEVRVVATRALGRVGGARAATTLLKSLAHPHPLPEGIVAMALLDVGAEAIPSLCETLRSDSAAQRSMATEALGPLEAVAAWRDIAVLLDDVDVRVRVNAVRALGQLGVPDAGDAVARCLEPAGPAALRAEAARALGQIGADRYVPLLVTGVENRDHSVAHNSAEALTKAGDAGYRALLMLAARSGDGSDHAREALAYSDLRPVRWDTDQSTDLPV